MDQVKYSVYFGRLGRNPELRRTQEGGYICDFSLAVNHGKGEAATWKRVVCWGKVAEQSSKRLSKGSEIFVRGRESVKKFYRSGGQEQGLYGNCGPFDRFYQWLERAL